MLAPVLYIIIGGFRTNAQITADPSGMPDPWVARSNYAEVLSSTIFWGEVANSTVAAVVTTVGVVALGLMTSFVLARYQFKARGLHVRALRRRPDVPDDRGDHAAVHRGAQTSA